MTPWILFDDCRSTPARATLFDQSVEWLTCTTHADVAKTLAAAERALRKGLHVAGAFAYELGYALEEKLRDCAWPHSATPLISLGLFERRRELGGEEIERWLDSASPHRPSGTSPASGGSESTPETAYSFPPPRAGEVAQARSAPSRWGEVKVTPSWTFPEYAERFAKVRDYIAAGDVYQVNLTFPLDVEINADLTVLYRDLRRNARSRYGAYMQMPDATVLSLSPELFFEIDNGIIRTRPMKGTVARAAGFEEDTAVAASLARDEKQCAENLMIVDLLRNDLSRIAERGTVEVEDLFTVETYPTLHTMTSGIRAQLRDGATMSDVLRAAFPCGSVTGAPKVRAMEIIRELESAPRGIYCGALGWFSGNDARLNVAIRTIEVRDGKARLNVGGGLVYDSKDRDEYDEALLKARFLTDPAPPFSLIETMRATREAIWLLERHIDRLRKSAQYFLFTFDEPTIRSAIEDARAKLPPGIHRMRLLLAPDGQVTLTKAPMPDEPATPPLLQPDLQTLHPSKPEIGITISPLHVNSADRYLRHKTTRRELYDKEFERVAREGYGEVLFLNERGEVTEGSRTNLFVVKNGALVTPPLASGVLNGCLRTELIETFGAVERVLTERDLLSADAVYVGNGLRGLTKAKLGRA